MYPPSFKATVALQAIGEQKTAAELAAYTRFIRARFGTGKGLSSRVWWICSTTGEKEKNKTTRT